MVVGTKCHSMYYILKLLLFKQWSLTNMHLRNPSGSCIAFMFQSSKVHEAHELKQVQVKLNLNSCNDAKTMK